MTRSVAETDAPELSLNRVLVIRLSAIGDVVFASPLIDAIKRTHPDAEVRWLAESTVAPLLAEHAGLKELLIWPRHEWWALFRRGRLWRLSREVLSFRRTLRAYQFDLVLDAQGLLKSAVLAWMTGARTRIGFSSKEPTGWLLTERVPKYLDPTVSSEYRGLAEHIGLETGDFSMTVSLSGVAREFAERVYNGQPYVVFCPFTTRPQKHWPESHWRSLTEIAYRAVPGRKGDILYAELHCSPCRRRPTCGGSFDCMSALTPNAVISAAQRYLSTESAIAPVLASSETREEAR